MPQAPSVQSIVRTGLRYFLGELQFRDFSGGLNIRDAAPELAANESPDLWNITLDERGAIGKRLGYTKYNSSAFGLSLTSAGDYWASGQNQITQAGTGLYKDTTTTPFKTFSTPDACGMADFKGLLIIVHPVDGMFKYDGTTVTALGAGPKGNCILTWQNKLWVSGDPAAKSRVYFSAAGDETSWPGTNFVDLREKDQEAVTALAGASGIDVVGKPGMLAAKRRSLYRIYDSSTGAFQTLDTEIGCASPQSFTNGFQRTVLLSEKGIFWTDGVGPLRPASDKIAPLFDPVMVNFSKLDLWRAGAKGDRMYFSLCRAGSTANDLELEYHPLQGWIVANSCAASFYTTYRANDEKLYAGSPTVVGQVYQRFSGGSDDGTAITSRWQQRWVEPSSGHPARIGRVRIAGRGLFTAELFKDYQQTASESFTVDLRGTAAVYNDAAAIYDAAGVLYGPVNFQDTQDYAMNEVIKAFSLRFTETSSGTSAGLQILGTGATPTIGAFGAYGLFYTYRPLGLG